MIKIAKQLLGGSMKDGAFYQARLAVDLVRYWCLVQLTVLTFLCVELKSERPLPLLTNPFVVTPWFHVAVLILSAIVVVLLELLGSDLLNAIYDPEKIDAKHLSLLRITVFLGALLFASLILQLITQYYRAEEHEKTLEIQHKTLELSPPPIVLQSFGQLWCRLQGVRCKAAEPQTKALAEIMAVCRGMLDLLRQWERNDDVFLHASVGLFYKPEEMTEEERSRALFLQQEIDRSKLYGYVVIDAETIQVLAARENKTPFVDRGDLTLPVHSRLHRDDGAPKGKGVAQALPPMRGAPTAVSGERQYVRDTRELEKVCADIYGAGVGQMVGEYFNADDQRYLRSFFSVPLMAPGTQNVQAVLTIGSSEAGILLNEERVDVYLALCAPLLQMLTESVQIRLESKKRTSNTINTAEAPGTAAHVSVTEGAL